MYIQTTHNPVTLLSNFYICVTWRWPLWTETCRKQISSLIHIKKKTP